MNTDTSADGAREVENAAEISRLREEIARMQEAARRMEERLRQIESQMKYGRQ